MEWWMVGGVLILCAIVRWIVDRCMIGGDDVVYVVIICSIQNCLSMLYLSPIFGRSGI